MSMVKQCIRELNALALASVFPLFCVGCKREGKALCDACLFGLGVSPQYYCPICFSSRSDWGKCVACHSSALDGLFAMAAHGDPLVQRALYQLKYGFVESIAVAFGKLVGRGLLAADTVSRSLVPVPMHEKRLRVRDFNQAELICDGVGKGFEIRPIIVRTRHTKEQAKCDREERFANVNGAFSVIGEVPHTAILIDDVATTGATLQQCALALKSAGTKHVYAAVFAHGRLTLPSE